MLFYVLVEDAQKWNCLDKTEIKFYIYGELPTVFNQMRRQYFHQHQMKVSDLNFFFGYVFSSYAESLFLIVQVP